LAPSLGPSPTSILAPTAEPAIAAATDGVARLGADLTWGGLRTLRSQIACVKAPAGLRCIGIVRFEVRTRRIVRVFTVAAGHDLTVTITLSARAARQLRSEEKPEVDVQLCSANACSAVTRLRVRAPRESRV
jgi:hypothetical protein